MLQYVDGRNTRAMDLIFPPDALQKLPEIAISSQDADFARGDFDGVQIDVLKTSNAIFKFVRRNETGRITVAGRATQCATPQGLLILKLYALPSLYRQGELARAAVYEADMAYLLGTSDVDPESALEVLATEMLATDVRQLRATLRDIPARGAKFESNT